MTTPQHPPSEDEFDWLNSPPLPTSPPKYDSSLYANHPPYSSYDTGLSSTTSLPPMPSIASQPSLPPAHIPPGSSYDTGLTSTPLPPAPAPSTPTPPWPQDRGYRAPHQPSEFQPDQAQQAVVFESAVRAEIKQLEAYFARQLKRFRLLGVTTLVCAAAVPVLIAADAWPWVPAVLGGAAAISGSLQTLYRFQDSALSAMSLANNLEAELVRYQTGTTPYHPNSPTNFNTFVDRTTNLRGEATTSFNGVWSSAQISS